MNLWYSEAQNRGTHGGDRLWTVCMVWVSQFLCGRVFFNWMWSWQSLLAVVRYASCNGWPGYELEDGIGSESQLVKWLEDLFFHKNLVMYPECGNETSSEYSELQYEIGTSSKWSHWGYGITYDAQGSVATSCRCLVVQIRLQQQRHLADLKLSLLFKACSSHVSILRIHQIFNSIQFEYWYPIHQKDLYSMIKGWWNIIIDKLHPCQMRK